jgi:hypothetical protein
MRQLFVKQDAGEYQAGQQHLPLEQPVSELSNEYITIVYGYNSRTLALRFIFRKPQHTAFASVANKLLDPSGH